MDLLIFFWLDGQEALAVSGDAVLVEDRVDSDACLKQGNRLTCFDLSTEFHLHRHQGSIGFQIEELLSISSPQRLGPSAHGNLTLLRKLGESRNKNFPSPRLQGAPDDPSTIRR